MLGTGRVYFFFLGASTLMVIFLEITGGSCGMCAKSANTNCRVCSPGGKSSVVSVCPPPKWISVSEAANGRFIGGISLAFTSR